MNIGTTASGSRVRHEQRHEHCVELSPSIQEGNMREGGRDLVKRRGGSRKRRERVNGGLKDGGISNSKGEGTRRHVGEE